MHIKRLSLIAALASLIFMIVAPTFACGTCGVTITKEPLYSGYILQTTHNCEGTGETYEPGVHHSDPTSDLQLNTLYEWWIQIEVTNWNPYTITNVRLADRFGAEFGVCIIDYSGGTGGTEPELTTKGKSQKVFAEWYIGSLASGQSATLILHVWTDHNPADKPEFTSYGTYEINSGAVVKWLDNNGKQHSAETMPIVISTIEEPST